MKKQDEGFTLIELLIVIVILGILAAVVVFAVGGITDRADENACDIDARTLRTAVEAYNAEYNIAPTMASLVSTNWLEAASTNYSFTVDANGNAVLTGLGACA